MSQSHVSPISPEAERHMWNEKARTFKNELSISINSWVIYLAVFAFAMLYAALMDAHWPVFIGIVGFTVFVGFLMFWEFRSRNLRPLEEVGLTLLKTFPLNEAGAAAAKEALAAQPTLRNCDLVVIFDRHLKLENARASARQEQAIQHDMTVIRARFSATTPINKDTHVH